MELKNYGRPMQRTYVSFMSHVDERFVSEKEKLQSHRKTKNVPSRYANVRSDFQYKPFVIPVIQECFLLSLERIGR